MQHGLTTTRGHSMFVLQQTRQCHRAQANLSQPDHGVAAMQHF